MVSVCVQGLSTSGFNDSVPLYSYVSSVDLFGGIFCLILSSHNFIIIHVFLFMFDEF